MAINCCSGHIDFLGYSSLFGMVFLYRSKRIKPNDIALVLSNTVESTPKGVLLFDKMFKVCENNLMIRHYFYREKHLLFF